MTHERLEILYKMKWKIEQLERTLQCLILISEGKIDITQITIRGLIDKPEFSNKIEERFDMQEDFIKSSLLQVYTRPLSDELEKLKREYEKA